MSVSKKAISNSVSGKLEARPRLHGDSLMRIQGRTQSGHQGSGHGMGTTQYSGMKMVPPKTAIAVAGGFTAMRHCDRCFLIFNAFEYRPFDSILRKNLLPVLLHIHDGPAAPLGLLESFVESTNGRLRIICILALGIGMMDDEPEARPRAGGGPLDPL